MPEHIDDLFDFTVRFASDMGRQNSKGRPVYDILQSKASHQHFVHLLNNSRVICQQRSKIVVSGQPCQ